MIDNTAMDNPERPVATQKSIFNYPPSYPAKAIIEF